MQRQKKVIAITGLSRVLAPHNPTSLTNETLCSWKEPAAIVSPMQILAVPQQ